MSFFGSKSEKVPCGVLWNNGTVQVLCLNKDFTVISYGETKLEPGTVISSCVADAPKLAAKIKEAMKNATPNPIDPKNVRCVACIPDNCTYITPFAVDLTKPKEEVASTMSALTVGTIPLSPSNLLASYYPLPFKKEKSVLYIGILRDELQKIQEVFKLVGTDFAGAEPSAFAINRAHPLQESSVVLSLAEKSVVATFRDTNGSVLWSFSVSFGGIIDNAFASHMVKEIADGIAYIESNLAGRIETCVLSGSELKTLEQIFIKDLNRKIACVDVSQSVKNNAIGPVLIGLALWQVPRT